MPENIIDKLKESKPRHVEVHNSDAATIAGVQEFLAAQQAGGTEATPETERVRIVPDRSVGAPGPNDTFMHEALSPIDNITVTEEEKQIYLKSLLQDTLTRLHVSLYDGKIVYVLRTRSMFEQRRVLDVINWKITQEEGLKNDIPKQLDMLQQYFALLMVERINNDLFSDMTLTPGHTLAEDANKLQTRAAEKFSALNNVYWTTMLNAMRVFEAKCAKLAEEAVNEDFWKPRG